MRFAQYPGLTAVKLGLKLGTLGSKSGAPFTDQIVSNSVPWIVPWGLPLAISLRKGSPASETQKSENGIPIQQEARDLLEGSWKEGGEKAKKLKRHSCLSPRKFLKIIILGFYSSFHLPNRGSGILVLNNPHIILSCHLDWEALTFPRQKSMLKSPQNPPGLTDECLDQLGLWLFLCVTETSLCIWVGRESGCLKSHRRRITSLRLKRAGRASLPPSHQLGFLLSQCEHIYFPFTSPFIQIAPTSVLPASLWPSQG